MVTLIISSETWQTHEDVSMARHTKGTMCTCIAWKALYRPVLRSMCDSLAPATILVSTHRQRRYTRTVQRPWRNPCSGLIEAQVLCARFGCHCSAYLVVDTFGTLPSKWTYVQFFCIPVRSSMPQSQAAGSAASLLSFTISRWVKSPAKELFRGCCRKV